MSTNFPDLNTWLEANQRADSGLLIVLILALMVLFVFLDIQWMLPKLAKYARLAIFTIYIGVLWTLFGLIALSGALH